MSTFVNDIREQAHSLRVLLDAPRSDDVGSVLAGCYDRVIVSGMGASHFANYQLWWDLVAAGVPAWWVEAGELLYGAATLIRGRTLLWLTSQSGQSGEVLALLDQLPPHQYVTVLAVTNDVHSPLARRADAVVDICAGNEHAVGTRTYLNTLAANHLYGAALSGASVDAAAAEIAVGHDRLTSFLSTEWDERLRETRTALGSVRRLIVLGRGRSIGNAASAALTIKEAAKFHAEGMSASQFRHGVIELANEDLTVVVMPSERQHKELDERLGLELVRYGARVVWVGHDGPLALPSVARVADNGFARYLTEVVPLQLAGVVLAAQSQIVPGEFVHATKVTSTL